MDNFGQLLIMLHKVHRAMIADKIMSLNLYPGQDGLLYYLSEHDGLAISELVEKLNIKHSTALIMVNRMELNGLVKKGKDNVDKRITRVYLTSKGEKKLEILSQIWQDIERQILKDFSENEKSNAKDVLTKLIKNLRNT